VFQQQISDGKMRIPEESARKAAAIIARTYGDSAGVWLFGSRANDDKLGGDVDFFVESQSTDLTAALRCKSDLADLFDLKVDLVVGDGSNPIHRIAKQTGVRLK
jgi:predicted nucleotidyltransferase